MDQGKSSNKHSLSGPTLTARAGLTFVSQTALTIARSISSLILTPVMLRTVGIELFGVWGMLQQLVSYIALSDLRPAGTLKYLLANRQHQTENSGENRRLIGISVLYSILSLPIFLILGFLAIRFLPTLISGATASSAHIHTAFAILLIGFFLDRILSIPSNILAANNFGYAGSVNSLIWVSLSLIGSVVVLQLGWGLIGVAIVSVIALIGRGIAQLVICMRVLPWVSIERPLPGEASAFMRVSGWLSLSAISTFLLVSADVLIIGVLLGARMAALYSVSMVIARAASQLLSSLLSSGNAGLLKLLSMQDFPRLIATREELHGLAVLVLGTFGPAIIAANSSLLSAWLGQRYNTDASIILWCIILVAVQILPRVDSILLDGFGAIRTKALMQLLCALILISSAYLVRGTFCAQMQVVLGCMIFANLLFLVFVREQVHRRLMLSDKISYVSELGLLILFLLTAEFYSIWSRSDVWFSILVVAPLITLITGVLTWRFLISDSQRKALALRGRRIISSKL